MPRGAAPRVQGRTKIPLNTALLEGRAEEQGSFRELKVKVASSGYGECSGDPAGTLSPGGLSPQELGLGKAKAVGGGVLEPQLKWEGILGEF